MHKIKIIIIISAKSYRTSFGTRCDFSRTGYEQCQISSQEGIAYNVNQCIDTKVCTIFSVAKATLELRMFIHLSVRQSVTKITQLLGIAPLTIKPIDHQAYRPSSLSTIKPIDHQAYQPFFLFHYTFDQILLNSRVSMPPVLIIAKELTPTASLEQE